MVNSVTDRATEQLYQALRECRNVGLTLRQVVGEIKGSWVELARDDLENAQTEAKMLSAQLDRPL